MTDDQMRAVWRKFAANKARIDRLVVKISDLQDEVAMLRLHQKVDPVSTGSDSPSDSLIDQAYRSSQE